MKATYRRPKRTGTKGKRRGPQQPPPVEQEYLKPIEAAVYLSVCRNSIYTYMMRGYKGVYLGYFKVGASKRTTKKLCDKFSAECRTVDDAEKAAAFAIQSLTPEG